VKLNLGSIKDLNNPLVLIHNTINKEINNFSNIELATVNRYNVVGTDGITFETNTFELPKYNEVLVKEFKWAIDEDNFKTVDSKHLYLKALIVKSFN